MEKHDGGIIGFFEIAEIINGIEIDITTDEFRFKIISGLSNYFKTLQNTGFNEKEFKKLCLD